jgi:NAD(P)H-hydrate epimerase
MGAAVRADVTVTFGVPKTGLVQSKAAVYVGRLEVAEDIGLIPCPFSTGPGWVVPKDFAGFPPRRQVETHKGTYGHLAIFAGSTGYHGAAVLAARGAQRAQPGLVSVFADSDVYVPVAAQLQSAMVHPWDADLLLPENTSALLAGPGLASATLTAKEHKFVLRLWHESPLPMIVDASALDWLLRDPHAPEDALRVIAPHPGEAARLLKMTVPEVQADRIAGVRELSRRFGNCWVVLKGHQTLIGRNSGPIRVNSTGNPYMAQGGSGDVLAGFIAGLLTQRALQTDPLRTLSYAVWEHGHAGDRLQATDRGWTIEDLVRVIGGSR